MSETVEVIEARLHLNKRTVDRLRNMLVQRHDFHYQAVGDFSPPPIVLHEFHDAFDFAMQQVLMDKRAQIVADEAALAQLNS